MGQQAPTAMPTRASLVRQALALFYEENGHGPFDWDTRVLLHELKNEYSEDELISWLREGGIEPEGVQS